MLLKLGTYPTIHKAIRLLLEDNGFSCTPENLDLTVVEEQRDLYSIEETLKKLTEQELIVFCIGDASFTDEELNGIDQMAIAKRSTELWKCHEFLEDVFDSIGEL